MKCVVCGKKGPEKNNFGLPACKNHKSLPPTAPHCPECETIMQIRTRKNGAFWGCPSFPSCYGSRNLANPNEEMDVL